ncbi:MAG: DNA topoisomerase IV subunit A [Candidatus Nitrosocaldus sp.]
MVRARTKGKDEYKGKGKARGKKDRHKGSSNSSSNKRKGRVGREQVRSSRSSRRREEGKGLITNKNITNRGNKRTGVKSSESDTIGKGINNYKRSYIDSIEVDGRMRGVKGKGGGGEKEGSNVSKASRSDISKRIKTIRNANVESQREKRNKVKTMLVELGKRIYNDLDNGMFPEVHIPSRSVANIVYDKRLRQYVLGNAKIVRSAKNIRHLRSFTQLIWLAFFVDKLVNEGKTSTLRDVYYSAQAFNIDFEDQAESDHIITDLEAVLSLAREDFNIYPEERSSIFGDLTIEYTVPGYEGKRLNLSDHPDGYLIGPSLSSAEFIDTSAEMVLAVEKGGIFTRFVEENVHKRFKAIIVDTAGQAPRSTRYLLMRLNKELNLPVYILTDGDVYGEHIAMVIKSGSANAAHLRELTVPDAKWIGVWASDIQKYKLPTDPMTEQDVKRCYELKQDPRYQSDIWRSELELFLKMRRKSELEAFAKYGLTKITDDYLPEKLEMAKSL